MLKVNKIVPVCGLLLIGLMIGCKSDPKPPEGTLSEEKMAGILADIHVAEARVTKMNLISLDSSSIVMEHLKVGIFKNHGVDSSLYTRSYKFYAQNPVYLERIYDIVTKELELRQKKKIVKGL